MEPPQYPGSSAGPSTLERTPAQGSPNKPVTAPQKEAVPAAKETIRETTEALKTGATETLETVKQAGGDYLTEQKVRLASKLEDYTAALDAACESLEQEGQNPLAGPANRAARGLEQAASYLRDTTRTEVLHDLGDLVRRRPEWIFGALFVAGLATARFLKATPRRVSPADRSKPPRTTDASFPGQPAEAEFAPLQPFPPMQP